MMGTKEFLKSVNILYIGYIPISLKEYKNESNILTQEQISNIMFPELLSLLQQEFKSWNDKLSLLHPKSMFILGKIGFFLSIFVDLKDYVHFCA